MKEKGKPAGVLGRLGPGLITGAADDDPSGIATYSQVGAEFGFALLWTMLFSFPLMAAMQEICARLGRITGIGIAANLKNIYPRYVSYSVVVLLCAANLFNLGADISAMAAATQLVIHGFAAVYALGFGLLSLLLQVFIPYRKYVGYLTVADLESFCVRDHCFSGARALADRPSVNPGSFHITGCEIFNGSCGRAGDNDKSIPVFLANVTRGRRNSCSSEGIATEEKTVASGGAISPDRFGYAGGHGIFKCSRIFHHSHHRGDAPCHRKRDGYSKLCGRGEGLGATCGEIGVFIVRFGNSRDRDAGSAGARGIGCLCGGGVISLAGQPGAQAGECTKILRSSGCGNDRRTRPQFHRDRSHPGIVLVGGSERNSRGSAYVFNHVDVHQYGDCPTIPPYFLSAIHGLGRHGSDARCVALLYREQHPGRCSLTENTSFYCGFYTEKPIAHLV